MEKSSCSSSLEGIGRSARPLSAATQRRIEELRRNIALLDEANDLERERLEQEQHAVDERRRAQEVFESTIWEQVERDIRANEARGVQEEAEWRRRVEEDQREWSQREARRQEQLRHEEERSKQLEDQRVAIRAEAALMQKWRQFEDELDEQWAAQEAEERRMIDEYASKRSRKVGEWDKQLYVERQKLGHSAEVLEAEFVEATRLHRAKQAASADDAFYGPQRSGARPNGINAAQSSPSIPFSTSPLGSAASASASNPPAAGQPSPACVDIETLGQEERDVLNALLAVVGAPRQTQKAKVKELLLKWHPDKNSDRDTATSTRIFQFVQRQRNLILGL